jgi:hypothetical protein
VASRAPPKAKRLPAGEALIEGDGIVEIADAAPDSDPVIVTSRSLRQQIA